MSSQTTICFGVSIDTVAVIGFPSVTSRYLPVSGGELSFQGAALTGGPRPLVVALGIAPSQPSSDALSTVASRYEFIPRDSSLSLKVHSSLQAWRCWSWWLLSDLPWMVVSIRCVCSRSPPVFRRVFGWGVSLSSSITTSPRGAASTQW